MIRQLSAFVSVIVRKAAAPSAGGPRQFMTRFGHSTPSIAALQTAYSITSWARAGTAAR
jgi:hypothetical protein